MNVYKILVWIHQRLHTQINFFFQLNWLAEVAEVDFCNALEIPNR